MYEFAERTVERYSGNKAKTEFYSQLFRVSAVEVETMSNSVRKFSKLHKFTNFLWESFRWLRQYIKPNYMLISYAGIVALVGNTYANLNR